MCLCDRRPYYLAILFLCLFSTLDTKQMFNINFADDWIRTSDLWYRYWPLYQLSHNCCPILFLCLFHSFFPFQKKRRIRSWTFLRCFCSSHRHQIVSQKKVNFAWLHKENLCLDGSPGLGVMGDNSCFRGCGFESWRRILDGLEIY